MDTRHIAGRGLFYLFLGQIIAVVATVLIAVPVIAAILAIVALVCSVGGLHTLSKAGDGYHTAFVMQVTLLVLGLISAFFDEGILAFLLSLADDILSIGVVYMVCTTTSSLLHGVDERVSNLGVICWKVYVGCTAAKLVLSLLLLIPVIQVFAMIFLVISLIVAVIAAILYMVFLYRSQDVLQRGN